MRLFWHAAIAMVLLLLSSVISCTYVWTKQFVPVGEQKIDYSCLTGWKLYHLNSDLRSWNLSIQMTALENIASKTVPPPPYKYMIYVNATSESTPDSSIVWDLMIDTLSVTFLPSGLNTYLNPRLAAWFSYASDRELCKLIYLTIGGNERESIVIPDGIDSLLIEFNAKVAPGELSTTTHEVPNLLYDTVIVKDYSAQEIIPIKFKMIRHDTKGKVPSFLVW